MRTQSHQTRNSSSLWVCNVSWGDSSSDRQVYRNICLTGVWKRLRTAPQSMLSPKYSLPSAGRNPVCWLSGYPWSVAPHVFCRSVVAELNPSPSEPRRTLWPWVTFPGKGHLPLCWCTLTECGEEKDCSGKTTFSCQKVCNDTAWSRISGAALTVTNW